MMALGCNRIEDGRENGRCRQHNSASIGCTHSFSQQLTDFYSLMYYYYCCLFVVVLILHSVRSKYFFCAHMLPPWCCGVLSGAKYLQASVVGSASAGTQDPWSGRCRCLRDEYHGKSSFEVIAKDLSTAFFGTQARPSPSSSTLLI